MKMLLMIATALMLMVLPAFAGDGGGWSPAPGEMVFASADVMPGCYLDGDGDLACVATASDDYHFDVEAFRADVIMALADAQRKMDRRYPDLAERFMLSDEEVRAITPTALGPKPKPPTYYRPDDDPGNPPGWRSGPSGLFA
jgi:hypothetical protein